MNSPYSCPGKWIAKLQAELDSGKVEEGWTLVPAATDTKWLSPLLNTQAICFWKGRIKFLDSNYQPKLPARQSHVLVYWGAEPAKFKEVFQGFGILFLPEFAQPRCLRPTQYSLETGNLLNTNPAIASPTQSIHQATLKNFGVYSSFASEINSNYAITSSVISIPQAAIESFGVYSAAGDIPDIHPTSHLSNDSIHQAPLI